MVGIVEGDAQQTILLLLLDAVLERPFCIERDEAELEALSGIRLGETASLISN